MWMFRPPKPLLSFYFSSMVLRMGKASIWVPFQAYHLDILVRTLFLSVDYEFFLHVFKSFLPFFFRDGERSVQNSYQRRTLAEIQPNKPNQAGRVVHIYLNAANIHSRVQYHFLLSVSHLVFLYVLGTSGGRQVFAKHEPKLRCTLWR